MANTVQSDLQWEREAGELIEGYDGSGGVIGFIRRVMISEPSTVRLKDSFCLQFIDPYGDTTFNQIQISKLLEELEALRPKCHTKEEREELEAIMRFIGKAKGRIHTYMKFYGD
jgi:midasin (ATPase involved in ribosome maturation)